MYLDSEAFEVPLFPHRPQDTGGNDLPSFFATRNVGKATLYLQGLDNISWHHPKQVLRIDENSPQNISDPTMKKEVVDCFSLFSTQETRRTQCIPLRFRNMEENSGEISKKIVEVLMINSTSGPGLLFPKGGWENDETVKEAAIREAIEEAGVRGDIVHFLGHYLFNSKTLWDEFSPEGLCKATMFALLVKEELECWPKHSLRRRSWLTVPEAIQCCPHPWMRQALEEGFSKWHDNGMTSTTNCED
ncbi:nudix hydrolase 16, mitochondrial-like [Solanum lycopersicum]|uniref:nudix hydrolase 16, mitochondrial-like n=1 Tax=Solanum lycopersicum TaxID=4081 RepID=UPI003749DF82